MAQVLVINQLTLDGVMQSPARPDEDPRDGFSHGGWAVPGNEERIIAKTGERLGSDRVFLLGRMTYEDFYEVWGKQVDHPFGAAFTETHKYVASHTLSEPLPWANSTVLGGDVVRRVAELKEALSGKLAIFGSGELIRSLMAADLVDEWLLMIHPLVLGAGRRLFAPGQAARLRLVEAETTATGVVIASYVSSAESAA